jgi:hypothetical protein
MLVVCSNHNGLGSQTLSRHAAGSFCTQPKEQAPFFVRSLVEVLADDKDQRSYGEFSRKYRSEGVEANLS